MSNITPFLNVGETTFSAPILFKEAKEMILNGDNDIKKVYMITDVYAKLHKMLKEDEQVKTAIENEFLKFAPKGKETQINGFRVKVYDKRVKEDFLSIEETIVEDYKILLEEIDLLTAKKKEFEEYMRQNCDVPVETTTVISVSSKRV